MTATQTSNSTQPPVARCDSSVPATQDAKPASATPAWINSISKPDARSQPWRAHEGIGEDVSFTEGQDMVRMADAEYPGGSLAA